MESLVQSPTGLVHFIASCVALVTGTLTLIMTKGTKQHRQVGYIYVAGMAVVIATSFMMYKLFGGWGIFHYAATLSTITLLLGMIPLKTKKPEKSWKYMHLSFMYWSVMGLYALFAAEMFTRIPDTPFFGMVGVAAGVIMFIGGIVFGMKKPKWKKVFGIGG